MNSRLTEVLRRHEPEILAAWMHRQLSVLSSHGSAVQESEQRELSAAFLAALRETVGAAPSGDISAPEWATVRENIAGIARARARKGFTPTETATFIFSLKFPLFDRLQQECGADAKGLADEILKATEMLDGLGLVAFEVYSKTREEVISRQQRELLELSTPVIQLWDGILALPLIGTLDSERTQVVMESLLQTIVQTGSTTAIIDITGVPTVDTLVAQYLLKTIAAARLMGADCIVSGVRPQIAQTIVHLGVELGDVSTKATLADAFRLALKRTGGSITSSASH